MDVDLCERLARHAPRQRRSVGNLIQKLVADGLDWLDAVADEATRELLEQNMRYLVAHVRPEELALVLRRQHELVQSMRRRKPPRAPRKRRKPRKPAR